MKTIETAIITLKDSRYKTLLSLRYLDGRSWEFIAEYMNYNISHIYKLHGQALLKIEAIECEYQPVI